MISREEQENRQKWALIAIIIVGGALFAASLLWLNSSVKSTIERK